MRRRARGFTLWELLCAVAAAAVVLGAGVPSLRLLVLDNRLTADVNAWVLAVQLARSEAAKRGRPVIVCQTADARACSSTPVGSSVMAYVNTDDRYPPQRSDAEPLLFVHAAAIDGTIVGNRPYFEFRPGRRRSTNGTVVFCDSRGTAAARALIVSYTGRPRVSRRAADGRPLQCAGVT